MPEEIEIGKVEKVDLGPVVLVIHTSGDPYQEAQAARVLLAKGMNQTEIGKILHLSQTNVSKRLRLLELEGQNIELIRSGKLKITSAYYLARDRYGAKKK